MSRLLQSKRVSSLWCALVVCIIASMISVGAEARANGAPMNSCLTLTPKHGSSPALPPHTCPFALNVTIVQSTGDNEEIPEIVLIRIDARNYLAPQNGESMEDGDRQSFRGFAVQARYANNPDIIVDGEFRPSASDDSSSLTRTYSCRTSERMRKNNTWTHRNSNEKYSVSAVWIPPVDFSEPLIFMATIVKNKNTFWEQQYSVPLLLGATLINEVSTEESLEDEKSNLDATESTTSMSEFESNDTESDLPTNYNNSNYMNQINTSSFASSSSYSSLSFTSLLFGIFSCLFW